MGKLDVIQPDIVQQITGHKIEKYVVKDEVKINKPFTLKAEFDGIVQGKKKIFKRQYGTIIPTTKEAVTAIKEQLPNLTIRDLMINYNSCLKFAGSKIPQITLLNSQVNIGAKEIDNAIFIDTDLDATKYQDCKITNTKFYNCKFKFRKYNVIALANSTFENITFFGVNRISNTIFWPDALNKTITKKAEKQILQKYYSNENDPEKENKLPDKSSVLLKNSKTKFILLEDSTIDHCHLDFIGKNDFDKEEDMFKIRYSELSYVRFSNFANLDNTRLIGTKDHQILTTAEKVISETLMAMVFVPIHISDEINPNGILVLQIDLLNRKIINSYICYQDNKYVLLE